MDELKYLIKVGGPKMVPFIKTVTIYFLLMTVSEKGTAWSTVFKCAPIVCLMLFLVMNGMRLGKQHRYSQKIFLGLVFSSVGDALLNLNMFPFGMAAFGLAHVFYISALGLRPWRLYIGVILYAAGAACVYVLRDGLTGVLVYGLPIYAILLLTTCWRALANVKDQNNKSSLTRISCAVGAALFVLSDGFIAFDMFYVDIPYRTVWVMTTYYAAQFGIVLSVFHNKPNIKSH